MNYSKIPDNDKYQKKIKRKRTKNRVGVIILRVIIIGIIVAIFSVLGGAIGAYMGIIGNAPDINTIDVVPKNYTSFVYDKWGNEIDSFHGTENREYATIDEIPDILQKAVVAIEDERFYDHNGVDVKGMFRALFENLKSGEFSQGASTITQQLIKNEVLTNEKKLERKIQEQYLAVILEKNLTKSLGSKEAAKSYILELYLNTIALNHGLNGVKTAAEFYYGKELSELTLAECASIAGITQNPAKYSPVSHPEENIKRQRRVLDKMRELNFITEEQYQEALNDDYLSRIVGKKNDGEDRAIHSYFVDQVFFDVADDLMEQKNMTKQQAYNLIYSGGLQIYSTQDMWMQNIVDESYRNDSLFPPRGNYLNATYTISIMDNETEEQTHITRQQAVNSWDEAEAFKQSVINEVVNDSNTLVADKLDVNQALQSAMVIIDYRTGAVRALIGGRGAKNGDLVFNRATQALRQMGSCFKVLAAYAPGIDLGIYYPGSVIVDEPLTVDGHQFHNWWGNSYRGASTVRVGIRDSMNILAVKALMRVGYDQSFEYMKKFGFTSLVDSEVTPDGRIVSDKVPSLALGGITYGVSVLELTAAYGTIANGGLYNKPITYTKVLDHDGNVILENKVEPTRVLKETSAYLLTDMMKDVITSGTGRLARFKSIKMPIAGKTGTTTDDKDLAFAGYTPYYVAGIWLGYDDPQVMKYDKSYHLLLWSDIMEKIHANLEYKEFERPEGITTLSLCGISGLTPTSLCSRDYFGNRMSGDLCDENFVTESGTCNLHKEYRVCMATGMLANEYCAASNIVLAVDSSGRVVNQSSSGVQFNLGSVCTVHNASNRGSAVVIDQNPADVVLDENGNPITPEPGETDTNTNTNTDTRTDTNTNTETNTNESDHQDLSEYGFAWDEQEGRYVEIQN
ncbi:MAG: PBP1A family penicillin-binding protein [Firmicutes bacterium]|nr:PBP1A family penicillin-binding protein [Bacillota bacterium]